MWQWCLNIVQSIRCATWNLVLILESFRRLSVGWVSRPLLLQADFPASKCAGPGGAAPSVLWNRLASLPHSCPAISSFRPRASQRLPRPAEPASFQPAAGKGAWTERGAPGPRPSVRPASRGGSAAPPSPSLQDAPRPLQKPGEVDLTLRKALHGPPSRGEAEPARPRRPEARPGAWRRGVCSAQQWTRRFQRLRPASAPGPQR